MRKLQLALFLLTVTFTTASLAQDARFNDFANLPFQQGYPTDETAQRIDWHVDLEASQFLTKQFYVGAVGYTFNQLTGDTGSGATLGPYISRISAVGPEVGYLFLVGEIRVR